MPEHLPPTPVATTVEKCVAQLGLDMDAVELRGQGPKRLLRVVVDADGGVPIDVITETSRELSRELDRSDVMGSTAYTLEVTSRGVDRPLTLQRHWTRNVGRLVVVTTVNGDRFRGRIEAVDEDSAKLEGNRVVLFADVKSAHVQPELKRAAASSPQTSERSD